LYFQEKKNNTPNTFFSSLGTHSVARSKKESLFAPSLNRKEHHPPFVEGKVKKRELVFGGICCR
jgi:hypothetical protein